MMAPPGYSKGQGPASCMMVPPGCSKGQGPASCMSGVKARPWAHYGPVTYSPHITQQVINRQSPDRGDFDTGDIWCEPLLYITPLPP